MDSSHKFVECSEHGKQQATYVCQHILQSLRDGLPRGFWSAEASADEPYPDSWCTACEERVNADGGWNDENESQAGVSLICSSCYESAKALNKSS